MEKFFFSTEEKQNRKGKGDKYLDNEEFFRRKIIVFWEGGRTEKENVSVEGWTVIGGSIRGPCGPEYQSNQSVSSYTYMIMYTYMHIC